MQSDDTDGCCFRSDFSNTPSTNQNRDCYYKGQEAVTPKTPWERRFGSMPGYSGFAKVLLSDVDQKIVTIGQSAAKVILAKDGESCTAACASANRVCNASLADTATIKLCKTSYSKYWVFNAVMVMDIQARYQHFTERQKVAQSTPN